MASIRHLKSSQKRIMVTKSKYDFISELLNKKKLSSDQKNKIQELIILELKKSDLNYDDLSRRVDLIEKKIKSKTKNKSKAENTSDNSTFEINPKKYTPKKTTDFLKAFNKHNILRYTSHPIDGDGLKMILEQIKSEEYNFKKHQKILSESFNDLSKKHWIPTHLFALIKKYILGEGNSKGWSKNLIEINWGCKEIQDWAEENQGVVPCPDDSLRQKMKKIGFEFNKPIILKNSSISNFTDLVIHFKHLFQIRNENSFEKIIQQINIKEFKNIEFEYKINKSVQLYTIIDKVADIYTKIIKMCIDVSNSFNEGNPKFIISYNRDEKENIYLSILHLNSTYKKDAVSVTHGHGDKLVAIIKEAEGVCNINLKAEFKDDDLYPFASINLFDQRPMEITKIEKFDGVEFKLIFPQ